MECVVPKGDHLRTLAGAIQRIGQIGKEIFFEGTATALTLRTLNESKSAFAAFSFHSDFFAKFTPPSATVKCKAYVKACQNLFRSHKHVQQLRIFFRREGVAHYVVFEFLNDLGMSNTHALAIEECVVFTAVFDRDAAANRLVLRPKDLARFVEHIQGSNELSLICTADSATFGSADTPVTDTPGRSRLKTSVTVGSSEFEEFHYGMHAPRTRVDFAMREFKAFLGFCDTAQRDAVTVCFTSSGAPVQFSADVGHDRTFTAELTLATCAVADGDDGAGGAGGAGVAQGQHGPTGSLGGRAHQPDAAGDHQGAPLSSRYQSAAVYGTAGRGDDSEARRDDSFDPSAATLADTGRSRARDDEDTLDAKSSSKRHRLG